MKLSLVVPVHNLEKYIEPMLCSLKYQKFDHDQVEPIFICDTCSDRTHEIIEDYLRPSYKNMVIIDREYKSSGLSRNDGIELASGDYIWLLDGDDWLIDNHSFKKVVEFFEKSPDNTYLRLGFASNSFNDFKYLYTVWQWVWRADLAKAVKFTSRKYDDDVEWVRNMFKEHGINLFPQITTPIYFYNFMREDSVMYWRKLEEFSERTDV